MAREEQRGSMFWELQCFALNSRRRRFLDAPPSEPDHIGARPVHSRSDMRGDPYGRIRHLQPRRAGPVWGHISRLSDQSDRSPPRKLSAAHPTDDSDHHAWSATTTEIKVLPLLCGRGARRPSVKPLTPPSRESQRLARLGN